VRDDVDEVEVKAPAGQRLDLDQEGEDRFATAVRAGELAASSGEVPHRVLGDHVAYSLHVPGAEGVEQLANPERVHVVGHGAAPPFAAAASRRFARYTTPGARPIACREDSA